MKTSPHLHGHAVLDLIAQSQPPLTRATLAATVRQQHGEDARFHTCSAGGMTLDALLAFLLARGKITEHAGRLQAVPHTRCHHEDGHPHTHESHA